MSSNGIASQYAEMGRTARKSQVSRQPADTPRRSSTEIGMLRTELRAALLVALALLVLSTFVILLAAAA